jgi:hypothetical protein
MSTRRPGKSSYTVKPIDRNKAARRLKGLRHVADIVSVPFLLSATGVPFVPRQRYVLQTSAWVQLWVQLWVQ